MLDSTRVRNSPLDKRSHNTIPVSSISRNLSLNTFRRNFSNSATDSIEDIPLSSGYVTAQVMESTMTLYMQIRTFSLKGDNDIELFTSWISDILYLTAIYVKFGLEHLVLDLSGNPGGIALLSSLLTRLLFPEAFPVVESETVPNTALLREILQERINHNDINTYITSKPIKSLDDLNTTNITVTFGSVNRTREWLGDYSASVETFENLARDLKAMMSLPDDYYISPQQVMLVVDGQCGSTCCFFVKRAQEEHLAKVIGLGANLIDETPFDSANFCGGPVYNSNDLLAFDSAPGVLPRGATLSLSAGNSWSFDVDAANEWLEYKVIGVDKVFPIFSTPLTNNQARVQLLNTLLPEFEGCFSWEVQEADCSPSNGQEHAKYGYPCNSSTGKFDQSQCVFARCEKGFYLSGNHRCISATFEESGSASSKSESDKSVPVWTIVVICVLGVLLIIAAIWIIILCLRNVRGSSETEGTEMKPAQERDAANSAV